MQRRFIRTGVSDGPLPVYCVLCAPHGNYRHVFVLLSGFVLSRLLLSQQMMDRLFSSASTASSINDFSEYNTWNLLLELLFFEQVNGIVDSFLAEIDLAKIAFSCHLLLIDSVTRRRCLVSVR